MWSSTTSHFLRDEENSPPPDFVLFLGRRFQPFRADYCFHGLSKLVCLSLSVRSVLYALLRSLGHPLTAVQRVAHRRWHN